MLILSIDLDGTIASGGVVTNPFMIGDPLPGAVEFLNQLSSQYQIVIHTARVNESWSISDPDYSIEKAVDAIRAWLKHHGMPPCQIWSGRGKPVASLYLDDRAVPCGPENYEAFLQELIVPVDDE